MATRMKVEAQAHAQGEELPMLAGIGAGLRWLEELLTMLSGPLLFLGAAVALVSLLTDGKLLASMPPLLFAWAISQAVGVDGQLMGASVKAGAAAKAGHWGRVIGYVLLILPLGIVAFLAANVFATQQTLGVSTQEALSRLGMSQTMWITARSLLSIVLVVLSGLMRYTPEKKVEESEEERARREARELHAIEYKRVKRRARVGAWKSIAATAFEREKVGEVEDISTPQAGEPSTGNDGAPSGGNEEARTQAASGEKASAKKVPTGLMTSPKFRDFLAENGVIITPEKAVAIVQGAEGFTRVGTSYAARRSALMRIANRMIEAARSGGNEQERSA